MNTGELELSTKPKPFVFVLMPIHATTENVYVFGIKGAASDVGAYAERVDEQNFAEGILERIFNQINKADVIVADMTGKNPNVFYEVGYAHALGKLVLLLTQDVTDIPFDLKHRQHIIYSHNSIDKLKNDLKLKLIWAIQQTSERSSLSAAEMLSVRIDDVPVPEWERGMEPVKIIRQANRSLAIPLVVQNLTQPPHPIIGHVSFYGKFGARIVPSVWSAGTETPAKSFVVRSMGIPHALDLLYQMSEKRISLASYGAVDAKSIDMMLFPGNDEVDEVFLIRIQTNAKHHDYVFRLVLAPS